MISDDEPIHVTEEDLLGRRPVAERIVNIVRSRPTSAPLVLALHGPWGSGKSSVLALVQEALHKANITCVDFQPWLFNNIEQLIQPFFATVYDALTKAGAPEKKLRKALERLSGILTTATKAIGHEVDFASLAEQSPSELRDEIKKVSEKLGKRIVVTIDDVDRLPLDELSLLLKLVRLCGNLPYFTYLLAYDRRVVSTALRAVYQGDSDFLDKIVQVEIPLPPVPPRLLADYVCQGLEQLGASLGIEMGPVIQEFQEPDDETRHIRASFVDNHFRKLIRTLRDAKRFLNGLSTTLPLVRHEVDLVDFAQIELIRVFFPVLYDEVYSRRVSLTAPDTRSQNDAKRQRRQREHQDMANKLRELPHGEIALRILCTLFPIFNASINTTNQHYGLNIDWKRRMKASDQAHVEKYFQLRVPLDSVPRKDVREAIDAANDAASSLDAQDIFLNFAKCYYERNQLSSFLDGVNYEIARVNAARLSALAEALTQLAFYMSSKPLGERELSTAAIGIIWIAKVMPVAASKELMSSIVEKSNASFALELLLYVEPNGHRPPELDLDFESMRAAFVTRIQEELVAPVGDLFEVYAHTWPDALRIWAAPKAATQYLVTLLRKKPARWANLATASLYRHAEQPMINLPPLHEILILAELAESSRDLDFTVFEAETRPTVESFVRELQLIPDVLLELCSIQEYAAHLVRIDTEKALSDTNWSTPAWTRARPRLEPIHAGAPWWPTLTRVPVEAIWQV